MKKLQRWVMLVGVTGSMMFGVNCTTQVRDALTVGVLEFITGTTTDTLGSIVTL